MLIAAIQSHVLCAVFIPNEKKYAILPLSRRMTKLSAES